MTFNYSHFIFFKHEPFKNVYLPKVWLKINKNKNKIVKYRNEESNKTAILFTVNVTIRFLKYHCVTEFCFTVTQIKNVFNIYY